MWLTGDNAGEYGRCSNAAMPYFARNAFTDKAERAGEGSRSSTNLIPVFLSSPRMMIYQFIRLFWRWGPSRAPIVFDRFKPFFKSFKPLKYLKLVCGINVHALRLRSTLDKASVDVFPSLTRNYRLTRTFWPLVRRLVQWTETIKLRNWAALYSELMVGEGP